MAAIGEIDQMTGEMVTIDEDEMYHDDHSHATESHYHHDWNSKNNMGVREWDRDLHHEEYNHMLQGEYEHEYDEYYYSDDEDDDDEDDDDHHDNDEDDGHEDNETYDEALADFNEYSSSYYDDEETLFDEDNENQDTTPDDGEKTPATDDGEMISVEEDIIDVDTARAEGMAIDKNPTPMP
jgi:hypothetical protein